MTPEQIAADVERGIFLHGQIELHKRELKAIEDRLKIAGENGDQVPLQNENLEGKQFIAEGSGNIVPVRFESDLIIGTIDSLDPSLPEIKEITGDTFRRFFKPVSGYARVPKDGEAFRKTARQLLAPDAFAKLIHLCTGRDKDGIAKSRVVVAWDDAKSKA
jgi:hypothetical protein